MRKSLFMAAAGLLACFASCESKKDTPKTTAADTVQYGVLSPTATKNLEALRGIFKCFNSGDFNTLGNYVADDCVDHGMEGDIRGLAAMTEEYKKWSQVLSNYKTVPITEMANDEYVVSWVRFENKMKIDQGAMRAGQTFDKSDIEVVRCKDGKVVEHWTFIDPKEMSKVLSPEKTTGQK